MQEIKSIKIKFDKLKGETFKAYLISIHDKEYWIPKSCCRNFTTNQKLGGNVQIATFIYEKMFNTKIETSEDIIYGEASWVVETHKPIKINPKNTLPNEQLTRLPIKCSRKAIQI